MNGRPPGRRAAWAWWVTACLAPAAAALAVPLGSAFTYQGQLKESGQPASGLYDLQVCLFDDPANPVPLSCIANIDDVMEFLVAGATAVQIGTANYYDPNVTMKLVDSLPTALAEAGVSSIRDIVGTLQTARN